MAYSWSFDAVWRHLDLIGIGALGTLRLTVSALLIAIPLGLALALFRLSGWRLLAAVATAYIDFFRSSAALVLIVWFYFAFPILAGLNLDAFAAASLAIGLQSAAYMAEVFRAGIQSIGKGQSEASRAIGMTYRQMMQYIILPQAFRRMLPILFIRIIELIKTTSLAATIAYTELVYAAHEVTSITYRPLEVFTTIALIYFVVIFGLSQGVRRLERRLAVSG